MQQIPLQLAAMLRTGTLLTGARVSKVTRSARTFQLEIEGKDRQEARAVVLAVAGNEGNRLLGGVGGWSIPESAPGIRPRRFVMPYSRRRWMSPLSWSTGKAAPPAL